MDSLPELLGTEPQVAWATTIRKIALTKIEPKDVERIANVVDATWWIANRFAFESRGGKFKEPAPYQFVGGPPPPTGTALDRAKAKQATTQSDLPMDPANNAMEQEQLEEQPDAVQFAHSVSQIPQLAEITILGLMAYAYKSELRGELMRRAQEKLKAFNAEFKDKTNRDVRGISAILGRKAL
jgi:hypothetical protein